jgi:hypothetical protein
VSGDQLDRRGLGGLPDSRLCLTIQVPNQEQKADADQSDRPQDLPIDISRVVSQENDTDHDEHDTKLE